MARIFYKSHKSQAALEFLTTYAWAFIVITITIGTLYYFGAFDFAKYLPQKCIFSSQLKCADFALRPSEVRVKLINNLGEDIQVNTVQITNDANPPISCVSPVPFSWPRATEKELVFTLYFFYEKWLFIKLSLRIARAFGLKRRAVSFKDAGSLNCNTRLYKLISQTQNACVMAYL